MLCARQEKGRKPMVKKTAKDSREIEEGTICCGNIWEAAFLIYQKIPFTKTEICNGKVTFVFPDTPEVQKILQDFIMNPEVRLQEYIGIFQRVKNLVYQIKGQGNGRKQGLDKIAQKNTE
jgi:hypothetical protein